MYSHARRLVLVILPLLLTALGLLTAGAALADDQTPVIKPKPLKTAVDVKPDHPAGPPPTVVRELLNERTAISSTFLLSDGTRRCEIYGMPIHYKDAHGRWQPLDLRLIPTGVPNEFAATSAPVRVVFGTEAFGGMPVRLGSEGATVGYDYLGGREGAPTIDGLLASYARIAPATDLHYQVVPNGVKETLVLASPKAPSRFSFRVSHQGLVLRRTAAGDWAFYRRHASSPIFAIGDLLVTDSANGKGARCSAATMSVQPGMGESTISYRVPKSWLRDPSRVYPVIVDPSTTTITATSDTYVSNLSPTTDYHPQSVSNKELRCGRSTAGDDNITLVKFNLTDAGLKTPPVYITGAELQLYQFYLNYSGERQSHVGAMADGWSEGCTWNSVGASTLNYYTVGDPSAAQAQTLKQSCRDVTQAWVMDDWNGQSFPNYGFTVFQRPTEGTSYYRKFRSRDYSTTSQRPKLVVDYDTPQATITDPSAAQVYRLGDMITVKLTLSAATSYANELRQFRFGINRGSSDASDYRGVFGWFDGGVPSDSWHARGALDQTGYWAYFQDDTDSTGTRYITPDLDHCNISPDFKSVTLRFRINEEFGASRSNRFAVYLDYAKTLSTAPHWNSGWTTTGPSFVVQPAATATTAATGSWFQEADSDNDGTPDANDTANGRGEAKLTWPATKSANGYDDLTCGTA